MPSYYAAGVKARLSICSLAASTTAEPCFAQSAALRDKLAQAQWTMDNGEELKEQDLPCLNEDGRLHFIGPRNEIPFICVGVDVKGRNPKEPEAVSKDDSTRGKMVSSTEHSSPFTTIAQLVATTDQYEDEDSSLTSLGSTPVQTPDRSVPIMIEEVKTKLPAKPVTKRKKRARSHFSTRARTSKTAKVVVSEPTDDVSDAESTSTTTPLSKAGTSITIPSKPLPKIKLRLNKAKSKTEPNAELEAALPESNQTPMLNASPATTAPSGSAGPKQGSSIFKHTMPAPAQTSPFVLDRKALTLNIQLLPICFTRTKSGAIDDLKIEVFFNGNFANSSYLSCREKNSLSELIVKLGGTRTHRLLERPWTIQPLSGAEIDEAEAQEDSAALAQTRQKRWKHICTALRAEVEAAGCNKAGKRPPSSIVLESLSNMPMPDSRIASLTNGLTFGVIDLVITLGDGSKKWENAGGYLSKPLRLQDTAFSISNLPKQVDQVPAVSVDHSELSRASLSSRIESSPMLATYAPQLDNGVQLDSTDAATYPRPTFASSLVSSPGGTAEPKTPGRVNSKFHILRAIFERTPQMPATSTPSYSSAPNLPSFASWSITKSQAGSKRPMLSATSPSAQDAMQRPTSLPPGVPLMGLPSLGINAERSMSSSTMPPHLLVTPHLSMLALPHISSGAGYYQTPAQGSRSIVLPKMLRHSLEGARHLTPLQRYARRPQVLIDAMAYGLKPRCNPIMPWSHGLISKPDFRSSGPNTPVSSKQKAFEDSPYTPSGPSILVKLRLSTPKKPNPATLEGAQNRVSDLKQGKRPISNEGNDIAGMKAISKAPPKLKRRQSSIGLSASSEPKQKRRRTSGLGISASVKAQIASSSPERSSMPPPPSPEKTTDDFVMPELSKGCIISYLAGADAEGHAKNRQVRASRGGSFKEREVLVATRFVVGL